MEQIEEVKKAVGKKGASLVQNDMIVGLGTGSTAKWAIQELVQLASEGLKIEVVATSKASKEMASKGSLKVLDINQIASIDITLDGADEIDSTGQMIKGAGGALFREKIIASMSKKMVALVDESKIVNNLGDKKPLPLEILPFGTRWIEAKLNELGFSGMWRKVGDTMYLTDNGNYIYDALCPITVSEQIESILAIPGVVETGLFLNIATDLVLGKMDGTIEMRSF